MREGVEHVLAADRLGPPVVEQRLDRGDHTDPDARLDLPDETEHAAFAEGELLAVGAAEPIERIFVVDIQPA